jgi:tetratricopeptide (TPR) repeat protein
MLKRFITAAGLVLFMLLHVVSAFSADSYALGLAAYKKGDYKRAVVELKTYVKTTPSAEAYYLLGYAYYKLGRHAEARRYFNEAYLIDPELKPETIIGGK